MSVLSPALGSLIAAWVRYCTTSCIGSTSPTGFSSSLQWQFTSVWTAVHHRIEICRSTASRSPVLTRGGICVPPTVIYLPYRVSGSTLTAVGCSQLLAQWPGTLYRILSAGIQRAAQIVLGIYLKLGIVELCAKILQIMRNDFKDYARTFCQLCAPFSIQISINQERK